MNIRLKIGNNEIEVGPLSLLNSKEILEFLKEMKELFEEDEGLSDNTKQVLKDIRRNRGSFKYGVSWQEFAALRHKQKADNFMKDLEAMFGPKDGHKDKEFISILKKVMRKKKSGVRISERKKIGKRIVDRIARVKKKKKGKSIGKNETKN